MSDRPDPDRPLAQRDAFNVDAHLWIAPRENPADDPRPAANGDLDPAAVARAKRLLRSVIG
jgi:hypothetical protein